MNINRTFRFQECLDTCKMIDIGFFGACYTWLNNRPLTQLVQERINCVFINAEWNALFPEACVKHLEKGHSNHYLVRLHWDRAQGIRQDQPFRFQPMWLSHPSFPDIVRDAWANPSSLLHIVSKFTNKAKVWNRNVFGNLFHRKKCILAKLRDVQIALSNNPNNFLVRLEQELRTELSEVLKLEEEYWAIKSRITWLDKGDRNIAFYHTSALVR